MPYTKRRIVQMLGLAAFATYLLAGCDALSEPPRANEVFDAPIEDLTPAQLRIHFAGDAEFGRRFAASDGLGPLFVAHSCDGCHPAEGQGHPLLMLKRFGRASGNGFDPMHDAGGPQLQNRALPGYTPEVVPAEATGVAGFIAPAVSGLGYLEAVDDATLQALSDPDDADGDGISGRLQLVEAVPHVREIVSLSARGSPGAETRYQLIDDRYYIGRFGKKAISVNLLHQTVNAYSEDMGITTELLPDDLFNPGAGNLAADDVPDPEISSDILSNVVFYLRTLRTPLRRNEHDPVVQAGERLFADIGCAACHIPTLKTGKSEISQLSEVEFHPYTDMLLHDMGPGLDDGYTEGTALTSEWRTPPLWGVGLAEKFQGGTPFYLHDGRAGSLEEAISFHGGEAAQSRSAFESLSAEEQTQLIAFLQSL